MSGSFNSSFPSPATARFCLPCSPVYPHHCSLLTNSMAPLLPSTLLLCLLLPQLPCSPFPLLSCSFAPLFRCYLAPLLTCSTAPHSMAALLLCSTTAALDCALSLVVKLYVRYYHIKLDYQSKGTSLSLRFTRCPGQCLAPLSFQQQTTTIWKNDGQRQNKQWWNCLFTKYNFTG